ncbi:MAG: lysophospholipid acyltransferase family protein [Bacteroidales bacterium]|nr:lysophospholipid acyltransferase family protein [Bacteroidales bacterium]
MKSFFYRIACWLLFALLWLFSLLPLAVHFLFARFIAFIFDKVLHYRAAVIDTNLSWAFPQLSQQERDKIRKENYLHLADLIVENIWAVSKSTKFLKRRGTIRLEGEDLMNEMVTKHGSVAIFTSHTGNWEFMGSYADLFENPVFDQSQLTNAYQPMSSSFSEMMIQRIRQCHMPYPDNLVSSARMLRFMYGHKDCSRLYNFIMDQYPGELGVVQTPFLGLPTYWPGGGVTIASKFKMPVVHASIEKEGRGKHLLKFILICENAAEMPQEEIIGRYAQLLEDNITRHKPYWLWSHKRWKNIGYK